MENAYADGELDEATSKDFFQVRQEGGREVRRNVTHYDLDAIISVGYRVHSPQGVHFRRWATSVLRQRILDVNTARMRRMDDVTDLLAASWVVQAYQAAWFVALIPVLTLMQVFSFVDDPSDPWPLWFAAVFLVLLIAVLPVTIIQLRRTRAYALQHDSSVQR